MLWQKIWRNVSLFFVLIGLIISSINPVEASDGGRVEVLSKAAILIDENSGRVLYQKSADLRMSPASLTKIMTALLVIEDGDLDKGYASASALQRRGRVRSGWRLVRS